MTRTRNVFWRFDYDLDPTFPSDLRNFPSMDCIDENFATLIEFNPAGSNDHRHT